MAISSAGQSARITGRMEQFGGLMASLPMVIPEIQGGTIKEARVELRRGEAMYRRTRLDRAAALVAAVYALRNSERTRPAASRVDARHITA